MRAIQSINYVNHFSDGKGTQTQNFDICVPYCLLVNL